MKIKLVDIHTHLIPDVDDGSFSIEESIAMVETMINDGITDVIATPHVQSMATTKSVAEQRTGFLYLKDAIAKSGLDINLYLGFEVRYVPHLRPDYEELTLNNSKYILMEFSNSTDHDLVDVFFNLRGLGLTPVIAHIERYSYMTLEYAEQLKKLGAIIQVNANSIIKPRSKHIKKLVNAMLKNEVIDIIASDMHNLRQRPNNLKKAYMHLKNKVSKEYLDELFYSNGKKIIENK